MVAFVSELRPDSCVVAEVRPSPNQSERKDGVLPDMIVLHYTGMRDNEAAIRTLCNPVSEVSAHYVVLQDGYIAQLVDESRRAWHAGVSYWAGQADINSCSIGIEIANPGHDHGYPEFPRRQIAAVTALCRSILTRHQIPADRILAHSDVAPARKQDPGEKFDWRSLAQNGVGLWPETLPEPETASDVRAALAEIGYLADLPLAALLRAFQRHWRPEAVTGEVDDDTRARLEAVRRLCMETPVALRRG